MDSKLLCEYKLPLVELLLDKTEDVFGFVISKESLFGEKYRFLIGSDKKNGKTNVYHHHSSWDIYGHQEFFGLGFLGMKIINLKLKKLLIRNY